MLGSLGFFKKLRNQVASAVGTVEKPERFLRRLFQAAVEMIKKKSPKATLIHFHGGGSFHSAFRRAFWGTRTGRVAGKQPSLASAGLAIVVYKRF